MSEIQATPTEPVEPAATPAPAANEPAPAPDHSWVPKRISEITAARRAAEARAAELEAENARLRAAQTAAPADPTSAAAPVPANQSVEQLARAYAEKMVRDQAEASTVNQRIQAINEAGAKEFGDQFEKSVQNLQMAGIGGADFLRVLTNVPKAEAVVTWLGKSENLNEAMRMATLDPVQMGIELTKLSSKAVKDLKPQISKAPPPIETVGGSGNGGDDTMPDPKDSKAWMAWRAKTRKSRR